MMAETIAAGGLEFFIENRTTAADGGPSLQVRVKEDERLVQLMRFDMLYKGPHYHYAPDGQNIRYDVDPLTLDDGIGWAIGLLQRKLPEMLTKAGHESLAGSVDQGAIARALPGIEARWREMPPEKPKHPAGMAGGADIAHQAP
jgi:hypothetical protein